MWKIRLIQIIVLYCCMGYFSFRGNIAAVIMASTFILVPYLEERRCEMSYKNNEGYSDPTAGKAVRAAGRMPTHIYNAFCVLNNTAGLLGLEITGIRDRKTGREWPQRR
ncbi:MAG: hypothetical protein ACLUI0_12810 [Blautia massiliensis (ex Durand et al. 2017)]